MGVNWRLDKDFQAPDGKLWSPKIIAWKYSFWTFVYVSSIIFRFRKRTFWRQNISDLECNKEIHLPLSLLKFSATETPVTFCRTQAAMLLPCYINFSYQSLESLYWAVVFSPAIRILWETAKKKNVAACYVMKVVNGKTPFIFISKTSAG